jgi:hypothetical protein
MGATAAMGMPAGAGSHGHLVGALFSTLRFKLSTKSCAFAQDSRVVCAAPPDPDSKS